MFSPTMNAWPIFCTAWPNAARSSGATSGFVRAVTEKRPASSADTVGSSLPTVPSKRIPTRSSAPGSCLPLVSRNASKRSATS